MNNNFGLTGFIFNEDIQWENVGDGIRRKILAYDKDLMLTAVEFKKGAIGYLHKHPNKQVSYIVKGSFEVTLGTEKKIQKAGDVYFVPSNLEHGVIALEENSLLIDVFSPYREDFIKQQ